MDILYTHANDGWGNKYPNEYQFSNMSSDESAQRATSVGKLIRVEKLIEAWTIVLTLLHVANNVIINLVTKTNTDKNKFGCIQSLISGDIFLVK